MMRSAAPASAVGPSPTAHRFTPWLVILAAAVVVGAIATASPGTIFVALLVLLVSAILSRCARPADRRFLVALLVAGFLVRAALSVGLDALAWRVTHGQAFQTRVEDTGSFGVVDHARAWAMLGDSDYYSERAYVLAQRAHHRRGPIGAYYYGGYGQHGYLHVLGAFYYLFDYSPVSVKLVNCLLGALLGPIMCCLTMTCFNATIARSTGILVSGFPSLVMWSATNLKDPSLFLLTSLLLLLFMRIREAARRETRVKYLLLFALTFVIHATLRSALYSVVLLGCLVASWLLSFPKRRAAQYVVAALMLGIGAVLLHHFLRPLLWQVFSRHLGYVWSPGTSYRFLPAQFYVPAYMETWMQSGHVNLPLLLGCAKGVAHFLLEPLPRRMDNFFALLSYPQMIVWYFALPLSLAGLGAAARWNLRRSLPLLLTLSTWIIMGALTSGNVGTVFRIRDMITPLMLLFTCAGAWIVCSGRHGAEMAVAPSETSIQDSAIPAGRRHAVD